MTFVANSASTTARHSTVKTQAQQWVASEGDQWFYRNRSKLNNAVPFDWGLNLLKQLPPGTTVDSVIDLGCANGWRVSEAGRLLNATHMVGVDVSEAALAEGRALFPEVEFKQSVLKQLPLEESFQLAIVAGVLHLIDRLEIVQTIAEIDRMVADGGFLLIGDFMPYNPEKRRWHHVQDVEMYAFKQNYADTFCHLGLYRPLASAVYHTADWAEGHLSPGCNSTDRYGYTLLQKSYQGYYQTYQP